MPRKYFRKFLPSHATIRRQRHIARFGSLLTHPNLWHLNRRSVAGGFALGMFAGLIPGPLQMLGAAILAVAFRVNLPVAVFTTLYTNPFTIVPLYVAAYGIGTLLVGNAGSQTAPPAFSFELGVRGWIDALVHWTTALGKPLLIGLPLLACLLAVAGYLLVWYGWRCAVIHEWRMRGRRRTGTAK